MYLLQADPSGISKLLFFGTFGMLTLAIGIVVFVIFHQRKVIRYQMQMKKMKTNGHGDFRKSTTLNQVMYACGTGHRQHHTL